MDEQISDLRFNLRLSIRYSQKLRSFWGLIQKLLDLATFAGGSAAVAFLLYPDAPEVNAAAIFAGVSVVSSVISLIVRPADATSRNHRVAREHSALLAELDALQNDEPNPATIGAIENRWHALNIEEGEGMKVLNAICYNEEIVARSLDIEDLIEIGPLQRFFSRVADFGGHKLQSRA